MVHRRDSLYWYFRNNHNRSGRLLLLCHMSKEGWVSLWLNCNRNQNRIPEICKRYICRRSWCWRSRTRRFWKSRHSPDWSCRRCTCRSCWCWRSRTSRTMTIRRNQGCLCRFGTCWDNRTNKKSIRRNSLPPFLLRKRCIQSDIYLDNRQNTIYSRKEC